LRAPGKAKYGWCYCGGPPPPPSVISRRCFAPLVAAAAAAVAVDRLWQRTVAVVGPHADEPDRHGAIHAARSPEWCVCVCVCALFSLRCGAADDISDAKHSLRAAAGGPSRATTRPFKFACAWRTHSSCRRVVCGGRRLFCLHRHGAGLADAPADAEVPKPATLELAQAWDTCVSCFGRVRY
jgi:hypothetical protein